MIRPLIVASLTILASGCASATKTYTADGHEGHSINCSGDALTWGSCLEKAGTICGALGYDVLEQSDETGAMISANQAGVFGTTTATRSMLIACKQ